MSSKGGEKAENPKFSNSLKKFPCFSPNFSANLPQSSQNTSFPTYNFPHHFLPTGKGRNLHRSHQLHKIRGFQHRNPNSFKNSQFKASTSSILGPKPRIGESFTSAKDRCTQLKDTVSREIEKRLQPSYSQKGYDKPAATEVSPYLKRILLLLNMGSEVFAKALMLDSVEMKNSTLFVSGKLFNVEND